MCSSVGGHLPLDVAGVTCVFSQAAGRYSCPGIYRKVKVNRMETYNVYMDELPTGNEIDGEETIEVEFRVVAASTDDSESESNAVIAGLDLVDLINMRDALQQEIDNYALSALEAQAGLISGENI